MNIAFVTKVNISLEKRIFSETGNIPYLKNKNILKTICRPMPKMNIHKIREDAVK